MMVLIQPPGWFKNHARLRFRRCHLDHLICKIPHRRSAKKSSEFNSELNSPAPFDYQKNGIWQPQFGDSKMSQDMLSVIRIHQVGKTPSRIPQLPTDSFHLAPFEVLQYCLTGSEPDGQVANKYKFIYIIFIYIYISLSLSLTIMGHPSPTWLSKYQDLFTGCCMYPYISSGCIDLSIRTGGVTESAAQHHQLWKSSPPLRQNLAAKVHWLLWWWWCVTL